MEETILIKGSLYFYSDIKPAELMVIEKGKKAIAFELKHERVPDAEPYSNQGIILQERNGYHHMLVGNEHIKSGSSSKSKNSRNRGVDFYEGKQKYYYDYTY